MIWLLALAVAASVSAGVYLALSHRLLRCVVGVSLIAIAANLVILASGRPNDAEPSIIGAGARHLGDAAAPLPQALALTAIVIGFALTCFSLVVVLVIQQRTGVEDSRDLQAAEPPPEPDGSAALEPDGEA